MILQITNQVFDIAVIAVPILISLASLIVSGFIGYRNSQLTTEVEKLKTENEKELHVHRAQYDKEYQIYETLWDKITGIKSTTVCSKVEVGVTGYATIDELARSKAHIFRVNYYHPYINYIEIHRPFYSATIYSLLLELEKLLRDELIDLEHHVPEGFWTVREKYEKQLKIVTDKICEAIRNRTSYSVQ